MAASEAVGQVRDQLAPALVYLRVSSRRQMDTAVDIDPEGLSIATQREECLAKAAQVRADVVREPFVEPGVSAKTVDERPVFRELLAYIRENPGIKYVITYNRARAFRNHFDAAIVQVQLKKLGVRLITVKDDFGEGPHAVAMEAMLDVMNGLQNTLQGLDIQTKMLHKAINGGTNGMAPVGYLNVRIEHEGKLINTVHLDPDRAPLVRKAWELYATGDYGLERLEATMADLGLSARAVGNWPERPVTFKWLHRMLRDVYYLGLVQYKGELYPGRHEPIVDQELFDRVQDVIEFRSKNGQRDRVLKHVLKGVFCGRCERNERRSRLIYTEAKGRNGTRYGYFLCRGRQDGVCDLPYLNSSQVEAAIVEHYDDLRLPTDFIDEVRHRLEEALADDQTSVRELQAAMARKLKDLAKQEDRLLDLAADGSLPQAKIKARLRKVQAERASAEVGLASATAELAVGVEVLVAALDLLRNPGELYRDADDSLRRLLNSTFFRHFFVDERGVHDDEKVPPFSEYHAAIAQRGEQPARSNVVTIMPKNDRSSPGGGASSSNISSFCGPTLAEVLSDPGSSTTTLVELPGIEPVSGCWPGDRKRADLEKHITVVHGKSWVLWADCGQIVGRPRARVNNPTVEGTTLTACRFHGG